MPDNSCKKEGEAMLARKDALQGGISFEEIYFYDLSPSLFERFNRHQAVNYCWRKSAGKWCLVKAPSVEEWHKSDIASLMDSLVFTLRSGGIMLGAFINKSLAGFATIEYDGFGPDFEYIQLSNLYVSYEHRRQGIGRRLFYMSCADAKKMGARKLYVSAHSAEETQAFFRAMNCVEAVHKRQDLLAISPCDCQLECVL